MTTARLSVRRDRPAPTPRLPYFRELDDSVYEPLHERPELAHLPVQRGRLSLVPGYGRIPPSLTLTIPRCVGCGKSHEHTWGHRAVDLPTPRCSHCASGPLKGLLTAYLVAPEDTPEHRALVREYVALWLDWVDRRAAAGVPAGA